MPPDDGQPDHDREQTEWMHALETFALDVDQEPAQQYRQADDHPEGIRVQKAALQQPRHAGEPAHRPAVPLTSAPSITA